MQLSNVVGKLWSRSKSEAPASMQRDEPAPVAVWTWIARLALVLLATTILYVATTSGFPVTHRLVHNFLQGDLGFTAQAAEVWTDIIRKSFHVPAYALLAALLWWASPLKLRRWWLALGLAVLVGTADELIQSRQPERTARLADILVDAAGALLGLWMAGAFRARRPSTVQSAEKPT